MLAVALVLSACTLAPPVAGPIVAGFAPLGAYAGHWGVDYGVAAGTPVSAAGAGMVTFAGAVAGMRTVTVDHGSYRTSLSYLSVVLVAPGMVVGRGDLVGLAGHPHGSAGVHLSLRVGERYQDPVPWLVCGRVQDGRLYLLPPDRSS